MKKNFVKTVVAAICVVTAGVGGMKAYNAANQSEADMLFAENVEALSSGDDDLGIGCHMCDNICDRYYGTNCYTSHGHTPVGWHR